MFRIREVKPEIRALGISVRQARNGHYQIVGVVYRGKLYLDGVLKAVSVASDVSQMIVEMIQGSSHIHQLRVILLDESLLDPNVNVNPYLLSREVSKPVIAIGFSEQTDAKHPQTITFRYWLDRLVDVLSVGLDLEKAQKILETTTKTGYKPEVLRIAGILALSIAESVQHNL